MIKYLLTSLDYKTDDIPVENATQHCYEYTIRAETLYFTLKSRNTPWSQSTDS